MDNNLARFMKTQFGKHLKITWCQWKRKTLHIAEFFFTRICSNSAGLTSGKISKDLSQDLTARKIMAKDCGDYS
jgi:hypothetical protein